MSSEPQQNQEQQQEEVAIVKARKMASDKYVNIGATPAVDIIIPFHGECSKVNRLVKSILQYTADYPYLITLVDDASPNKNFSKTINDPRLLHQSCRAPTAISRGEEVPFVKCIRNKEQKGFGASLNAGLINTERPIVVFMHSDCEVKDRKWLINLVRSLDGMKKDGVKMVSAKCNNPGASYPKELLSMKKPVADKDIVLDGDVLDDSHYIPFYCTICNRQLFNYVGGGFREYPYAWYEDLEFACRMRMSDFMQGISGNSWVWHEGNGTIKKLCAKMPKVKEIMESNRKQCIAHIKAMSEQNKE